MFKLYQKCHKTESFIFLIRFPVKKIPCNNDKITVFHNIFISIMEHFFQDFFLSLSIFFFSLNIFTLESFFF